MFDVGEKVKLTSKAAKNRTEEMVNLTGIVVGEPVLNGKWVPIRWTGKQTVFTEHVENIVKV